MPLLLDTCVLIWLTQEPEKLSLAASNAINDPANLLLFSHVSAWELHLKHHAGKLTLPDQPKAWIAQQMAIWKLLEIQIELNAISRTSELPDIHKDPFDRLLIAQALEGGHYIVSPDHYFTDYGVPVIW